jgi:hypothetical protein
MFPDRDTVLRAAAAIIGVTVVGLLFIASYAGALHDPQPRDVPVAVAGPPRLAAALAGSRALKVVRERDARAARRAIDERQAYGAVIAGAASIEVVVAPAASQPIALLLRQQLPRRLQQAAPVRVSTVHPLPRGDSRGIVPFYVVVGWVVAGYLATSLLGVANGMRPGRMRVAWRMVGVVVLGVLMGVGGAILGHSIGDLGGSVVEMAVFGMLTVIAVGWFTMGVQAPLGIVGTGVAILVFVVLGNPASGGPFARELLPEPWRAVGDLIPTGAGVSATRDIAYFPDASLGGPLVVLLVWAAVGGAAALVFGASRRASEARSESVTAARAAA